MKTYKIYCDMRFRICVEAESEDEAKDLLYNYLWDMPCDRDRVDESSMEESDTEFVSVKEI